MIAVTLSCDKDLPAPFETDLSDQLAAPTDLKASLGKGRVILHWKYQTDTTQLKEFRIYRSENESTAFARIGSSAKTEYADTMLVNGTTYSYKVMAVNLQDFESEPSTIVSATPSLYSLLIENGVEATRNSTVNLRITAPENTAYMMLANDSTFEFANWEPFSPTRNWLLGVNDGLKTIYAKFMNTDNIETLEPVTAKILLDTYAQIISLKHDGYGRVLKAGDNLHITMEASDIGGSAKATIIDADTLNNNSGSVRQIVDLILYDNGTEGDAVAGDGVYELDYRIDRGLEIPNAEVTGSFTDQLGNSAPTVKAPTSFVLSQAPSAVILQEPANANQSTPALILRWSGNNESDFESYQIYRSRDFLVTLNSTLVADITDSRSTRFVDETVEPSTLYYYSVFVFDTAGNYSQSNIASAKSPENTPPKPVVLSQAIADSNALAISWSPSTAPDFVNYQLYRSTSSKIDTSFAPIRIFNDINQTSFRDVSVARNIDYYYQIFVVDRFGLMSGSNIVNGRID